MDQLRMYVVFVGTGIMAGDDSEGSIGQEQRLCIRGTYLYGIM